MIIADENIERYWISLLRAHAYDVLSVREQHSGINDVEVVQLVQQRGGILITEDKDFGELVFAHGIKGVSIIFLRYDQPFYGQIESQVLSVVKAYHAKAECYFITITEAKVRVRRI